MPKRVIDADAMWKSDKLAACHPRSVPEYPWLYGLADANGNFELTSYRAIHSDAYAPIRPTVSIDQVREFLEDFHRHGLLYVWMEHGKRYGHWTGSEKPGRLPPKTQRNHFTTVKCTTPSIEQINKYVEGLDTDAPQLILFTPAAVAALPDVTVRNEPRVVPIHQESGPAPAPNKLTPEQQKRFDQTEQTKINRWHEFWGLYPASRRHNEYLTRELFTKVTVKDMPDVLLGLEAWIKSRPWQDESFIPFSDNFLENFTWKTPPPKEPANGRRTFGPAGRTTEDYDERMRKNAKTLGLDRS